MKATHYWMAASAAVLTASVGTAIAQGVPNDAYARDAAGQVVKNPFGLCWRTYSWTPEKAIAECDPDRARPAPRAAAPAPAPAAPRPADSDGDGVPDNLDKCPGTPAGAKVDAQGCELDSDGDGVVDRLDQCAGTPAGAKVDARGCELDSDGDGVVDRLDRCPNTVAGARVDARGCEMDSDGDGVVDRLDRCPNTRAGVKVDANGCDIPDVVVLKGVNFASNSARLTPQSAAILDDAAATLIKRGDVRTEVAGHTDNQGAPARNLKLSQARAEAVMRYLVSKGVNAANLTARGYGEERPIADNRTESGRAANRRVELRALQ